MQKMSDLAKFMHDSTYLQMGGTGGFPLTKIDLVGIFVLR